MGLVQNVASKGLLYSLGIVFNRIVPQWLFRCRRYVVLEMKPGQEIRTSSPIDDRLIVKWCESEPDYRSVERITYFCRHNQPFASTAAMAAYGQQTVAGFWFATDHFVETELGVRYDLLPDQSWLFAAQVDKEFRNRGIHQRLLQFMISGLNQMGFPHVLLAVNPNNKPSLAAHQKHANQHLGSVLAIRLLNFAACLTSGDGISRNRSVTLNCQHSPIVIKIKKASGAGATGYGE